MTREFVEEFAFLLDSYSDGIEVSLFVSDFDIKFLLDSYSDGNDEAS